MRKSMFILFIISSLFVVPVSAQQHPVHPIGKETRILERKLQFFKNRLGLTEKEYADFEVIYRDYAQKKASLDKAFRKEVIAKIRGEGLQNLTEAEKRPLIDKKLDFDRQRYELGRNLTLDLRKVLPSEKLIQYFKLERQFKRALLKRLKNHRQKAKHRRK